MFGYNIDAGIDILELQAGLSVKYGRTAGATLVPGEPPTLLGCSLQAGYRGTGPYRTRHGDQVSLV